MLLPFLLSVMALGYSALQRITLASKAKFFHLIFMKKRTVLIVGGIALAILLGVGGLWWWRQAAESAALGRTFVAAERALAGGRWAEARVVLEDQARRRGRPDKPEATHRWRVLEFKIAGGLRDFATLEALAVRYPTLAGEDESSALWLWRVRRAGGDEAGAEAVRALWRGREHQLVSWICAEVDALAAAGQRDKVRTLLAGLPPTEAKAVPLLLRKAIFGADAAERFQAMTEAYRVDPRDADLRGMRATVLERAGQPDYARVDYVAALLADPRNPLRRDELASFYLRQGDLADAVDTWREGLDEKSPDFMWVRAVFWGRVLGQPAPEIAAKLPETRRHRFAGWLATLPAARFWDETGYAALHLSSEHAEREPAVFWLRVLEQLRQGDWSAAAERLVVAPTAAQVTAPTLYAALRLTAAVRAGVDPVKTGLAWPGKTSDAHRWWGVAAAALRGESAAVAEFAAVAKGPCAASAACLVAGWMGPALALADEAESAKETTPSWVRYGLLQARRTVRGPADALAWGEKLPAYPPTDYVVASLRLAAGRTAEAEAVLRALALRDDDTGFGAAWLLGTWLLEKGRVNEAYAVALSPAIKATPEGVGLRARVAIAQGHTDEAVAIYSPLAETSLEAGAYLARVAYAAGDLARARRLTEFWLTRFPDNLQLRANLNAVAAAEQKAGVHP